MALLNSEREELEHTYLRYLEIFIISKERNAHLFRTFVDNWFAYHSGGPFLNRAGRPKWFNNPDPVRERDALLEMHFISTGARAVLDGPSECSLVKDHAIPLLVLRERLFQRDSITLDEIRNFLIDHYRLGLIAKWEDRKLARLRMRQRLPTDPSDVEWLSRYDAAGILRA